jgi:hypothetical protein
VGACTTLRARRAAARAAGGSGPTCFLHLALHIILIAAVLAAGRDVRKQLLSRPAWRLLSLGGRGSMRIGRSHPLHHDQAAQAATGACDESMLRSSSRAPRLQAQGRRMHDRKAGVTQLERAAGRPGEQLPPTCRSVAVKIAGQCWRGKRLLSPLSCGHMLSAGPAALAASLTVAATLSAPLL